MNRCWTDSRSSGKEGSPSRPRASGVFKYGHPERHLDRRFLGSMLYTPPGDPQPYLLNLVDTPGHVDFSAEVTRSLLAVQGALLLIDASQGVQSQTLEVLRKARARGLEVVGVVNKVSCSHLTLGSINYTQMLISMALDRIGRSPKFRGTGRASGRGGRKPYIYVARFGSSRERQDRLGRRKCSLGDRGADTSAHRIFTGEIESLGVRFLVSYLSRRCKFSRLV
jgi:hypothetical protein